MRKTAAALIMTLLIIAAAEAIPVRLGKANPSQPPSYPETPDTNQTTITIQSPTPSRAFGSNVVSYSFAVQKPHSWFDYLPVHGDLLKISYILDGKTVDVASSGLDQSHYESKPLSFNGTLTGLAEGNHSLQVYVRSVSYYLDPNRPTSGYGWWLYPPLNYYMDTYSDSVHFIVDTTLPRVQILSIENKTYDSGDIQLDFTTNEPGKISYCLDNQDNVTISGNTTLSGLSSGLHTLKVLSEDEAGNVGASETVAFTLMENQRLVSEPIPIAMTVAALVMVAVVGTGLLLYFGKKRKAVIVKN